MNVTVLDQHYSDFNEAYCYHPTVMLVSRLIYLRYEASLFSMTRFIDSEGAETATKWLAFRSARVYCSPMLRGNEVFFS